MKLASLIAATLIAAAGASVGSTAAHAHAEHGQPQYGGIFAEGMYFQTELVLKDQQAVIYITLHGAPQSTQGASGKLTVLAAGAKQETELKPAADNQLVATLKTKPGPGSKLVVTIRMPGQPAVNVRFALE
ncbi:MAG TPA: hypothetical protein VN028_04135 [Rhodocyclaceae bacterium]|nr:hypothetical protein [Rhodocyclaceae bacterium]